MLISSFFVPLIVHYDSFVNKILILTAAECLKIKGLAVPDDPMPSKKQKTFATSPIKYASPNIPNEDNDKVEDLLDRKPKKKRKLDVAPVETLDDTEESPNMNMEEYFKTEMEVVSYLPKCFF